MVYGRLGDRRLSDKIFLDGQQPTNTQKLTKTKQQKKIEIGMFLKLNFRITSC